MAAQSAVALMTVYFFIGRQIWLFLSGYGKTNSAMNTSIYTAAASRLLPFYCDFSTALVVITFYLKYTSTRLSTHMPQWTVKAALFALFLIYCIWVGMSWGKWGADEDGTITQLMAALGGAIFFGFLAVLYIIPMIGELSGRFVYSSGEEIQTDEDMRAAVLVAQGNYEEAIAEFQKKAEKDPEDRFPVTEIAKVHLEHLNDPQAALDVLHGALDRGWQPDDAAFILFKIADIQADHVADFDSARETLKAVVEQLPDSRHSANATHKLRELDQKEATAKEKIARGESPIVDQEEEQLDPKEAARLQREKEEEEFLSQMRNAQNQPADEDKEA